MLFLIIFQRTLFLAALQIILINFFLEQSWQSFRSRICQSISRSKAVTGKKVSVSWLGNKQRLNVLEYRP